VRSAIRRGEEAGFAPADVIGAAVMVAKIGPRLYDTQAACYVTLGNLQSWAAKGIAFVVIDAYAPIRECV